MNIIACVVFQALLQLPCEGAKLHFDVNEQKNDDQKRKAQRRDKILHLGILHTIDNNTNGRSPDAAPRLLLLCDVI